MRLWAHMLVKNEERWIWYSVGSIVHYVEKVLLWDSGSTDKTIEIVQELRKKFGKKIEFVRENVVNANDFTVIRQKMLDATQSDWFLIVDGDEIWWEDSVTNLLTNISNASPEKECVVVPTINLVGDIFHKQSNAAGRYKFGSKFGNYNLRAVRRDIPGLHSQGIHGVWGWADKNNRMIQERGGHNIIYSETPYLHTTFLQRGGLGHDKKVIKRGPKLKHEIGDILPTDFYYPEVFFRETPKIVPSPWGLPSFGFWARSFLETPIRKIKRRIVVGKVGY